jgi:CBS domain containing-hemolysin-like protein
MEDLPSIFLIFGLIFLNGAFVAAEFAIARLRRTQVDHIAEDGSGNFDKGTVKAAKILQDILEHINDYISACQVGITISSLALGAVAEAQVKDMIAPLIGKLPFYLDAHSIAITFAIAFITFFHVILGEIVPKNLAILNPEKLAFKLVYFLKFLHLIFRLPIYVLNKSSDFCLKLVSADFKDHNGHTHSEAELKLILSSSQAEGVLEEEEEQLIQNVFDFNDTIARDIMIPRTDMTCLRDSINIREAAELTNKTSFSRFPVFHERLDNIVGYVNIKDILKAFERGHSEESIMTITNEILKVPDGMYIIDLIKLMQQKKKQLAVLIDEFGGTSGLVTVEDIVEEIFGEIEDEDETSKIPILKVNNSEYLIDGLVTLDELNSKLDIDFHSDHYETIGGLVFGLIGTEPKFGDKVDYNGYRLIVEKHSKNRVRSVRLIAQ